MPFDFRKLELTGTFEILPGKFADNRGFFSEVYNQAEFARRGIPQTWIQDNHIVSTRRHVLRGLHYQRPPLAQDKLVRALCGAVLCVVVDIRKGSPTFRRWTRLEISTDRWNQLLVPKGFAFGMLSLDERTEVLLRISGPHSPAHDAAIRYDDPEIGVDWGLNGVEPVLSARDRDARPLCQQNPGFFFET